MEVIQKQDMLNWNEDNEIINLINGESIYYSDVITKINHYGLSQERQIILTNEALYNMKNKNLKRRLPYNEILGITFSNSSNEFVVHGKNSQYDYQYNSQDKNLIISMIIFFYDVQTNESLKLCEVCEKTLKNFVTGKKEKQKDCNYTKMDNTFLIDTKIFQEAYMETLFFGGKNYTRHYSEYYSSMKKSMTNSNVINNNSNSNSNSNNSNSNNSNSNSNHEKNYLNTTIFDNSDNFDTDIPGTIFSKHKMAQKVNLNDFKIIKVIGRGAFGKVCLVQYKLTKEYFAMKSMKKDVLLEQNQVRCILTEKKILQNLNYPFLVGMVFCFQTEERIYFVMPFIRGGELYQHLRKSQYFSEEKTKFYAAIIGLSLEYLHTHGIVYRDIKPANILMDEDGYLKLGDFGMAKMLKDNEKANSFCGTREYLPPEIITREGHNKAADWWSYGILVYEMLFGIPPFFSINNEKLFTLITQGDLKFPSKIQISKNAKDFIKKLLIKNQNIRLGSKNGFEEIKQHPFFSGFNFKALEEKKLEAPFKPVLEGSLDLTNFDSKYTSEEVETSVVSENGLDFIKKNQDQFKDFNE